MAKLKLNFTTMVSQPFQISNYHSASPKSGIRRKVQGRFIHKAEEAEASGPTKPRGPPRPILLITLKIHGKRKWQLGPTLVASQTLDPHYLLYDTRISGFDIPLENNNIRLKLDE